MSSFNERQSGLIADHAESSKAPQWYVASQRSLRSSSPFTAALPVTYTHTLTSSQNAIGNLSGSEAWSASGEEQKKHAVDAMKEAGDSARSSAGLQKGRGDSREIVRLRENAKGRCSEQAGVVDKVDVSKVTRECINRSTDNRL
jgi:hypothetical protein